MSPPKLAQGRQSPTEECWWDKIQPLGALESPSTAVPSSHTLPTPGRHPGGSSQLQQIFGTGRCVPNCGAGQGGAGEPLGCPSPCHRGSRGCQGWFLGSSGLLGRPKAGVFIPYSHCCCIVLAFQVPGSSFTPHSCCPLPAQEGPRCHPWCHCSEHLRAHRKRGINKEHLKIPSGTSQLRPGPPSSCHPQLFGACLGGTKCSWRCSSFMDVVFGALGHPSDTAGSLEGAG